MLLEGLLENDRKSCFQITTKPYSNKFLKYVYVNHTQVSLYRFKVSKLLIKFIFLVVFKAKSITTIISHEVAKQ